MSYVAPPNYRKVNHSFHFILTVVTFGAWSLVWMCIAIYAAMSNSAQRKQFQRDSREYLDATRMPQPPQRQEFVHGVPYPVRHAPLPVIPQIAQRPTVTPHNRAPRIRPYVQPTTAPPQPPAPTSAPAPVQPVVTPRVVTPVRPVHHVKPRPTKTREDCP